MKRIALLCAIVLSSFLVSASDGGTTYFLVTEYPGQETHNDSFVLPLSNPTDIAHARDLIARGPDTAGAPIVSAKIAKGSDGINRNVLAEDAPEWNWHITEFGGFVDSSIEINDGWPTFVEQDVDAWIQNTQGYIGFWSYTVTREIPGIAVPLPSALPAGSLLIGLIVAGKWGLRHRPVCSLLSR